MNQPAAKDPSMDEILSSIRQIISTDDAPAQPEAAAAAPEPAAAATAAEPETDEPLSLSADQMVAETVEPTPAPEEAAPSVGEDDVDPAAFGIKSDDIGFADEEEAGADAAMAAMMDEAPEPSPEPAPAPKLAPKAPVPPKPEVAAEAPESPLPDKKLSGDIADGLLEPAARAASSQAFAQLNKLGFEADNGTVEGLIREMLRPMLKGWLDENLPSIVERLVQTEIERVSRGR